MGLACHINCWIRGLTGLAVTIMPTYSIAYAVDCYEAQSVVQMHRRENGVEEHSRVWHELLGCAVGRKRRIYHTCRYAVCVCDWADALRHTALLLGQEFETHDKEFEFASVGGDAVKLVSLGCCHWYNISLLFLYYTISNTVYI